MAKNEKEKTLHYEYDWHFNNIWIKFLTVIFFQIEANAGV